MRLVAFAAAAAALLVPSVAAAAAAEGSSTALLAPGEVLLEVDGVGSVTSPADRVQLLVHADAEGATPAEARRASRALVERLTEAAEAAGVAAGDVEPAERSRLGFVGNEALDAGMHPRPGPHKVRETLAVRLPNASAAEAVRTALETAGAAQVIGPEFALVDDREAARKARAEAVADARLRAEDYAAALGLRVARVLRVSERAPAEHVFVQEMLNRTLGATAGADGVETRIRAVVDFALLPAR